MKKYADQRHGNYRSFSSFMKTIFPLNYIFQANWLLNIGMQSCSLSARIFPWQIYGHLSQGSSDSFSLAYFHNPQLLSPFQLLLHPHEEPNSLFRFQTPLKGYTADTGIWLPGYCQMGQLTRSQKSSILTPSQDTLNNAQRQGKNKQMNNLFFPPYLCKTISRLGFSKQPVLQYSHGKTDASAKKLSLSLQASVQRGIYAITHLLLSILFPTQPVLCPFPFFLLQLDYSSLIQYKC